MVEYEALKDIETFDQEDDVEEGATSINEIILRQIRKLGDISSSELTGGFWQKKPIRTAGGVMFTEEYHEDKREAYSNTVDFIVDIVYPISDDEFRKFIDDEEVNNIKEPAEKQKSRKKIFRELNKMFERTEFFNNSIDVTNVSR